MGRSKTSIPGELEELIRVMTHRGETALSISNALASKGVKLSVSSINQRMIKIRGKVKNSGRYPVRMPAKGGLPRAKPKAPRVPEEIPSDASPRELRALYKVCTEEMANARAAQNLPLVGQLIRVAASLQEHMRKASPPPPPDPNEQPDFIKLARETVAKLHKMVDEVTQ